LWLAPRVIIVGDDKQCAPSFAIQEHQKVFDRLDAYLPDLRPAFRDDFRPGNNLYQLLSARFPDVVRLTEHFRCMPEIIGWSSAQFYDPPLQPLRQFGADRLDPLRGVTIEGAYTEGCGSSEVMYCEAFWCAWWSCVRFCRVGVCVEGSFSLRSRLS